MVEPGSGLHRFRGIAFVGNYLPRKCGIATFTFDLAESLAQQAGADQPVIVCAMNDLPEGYAYPERVKFEVSQDYPLDYNRLTDFLNFSRIDVVSLQHEYGIFGGESGANILTLLRDLHRPVVVTCHTVLKNPSPVQKEVFGELAQRATRLVVMSRKAFGFLEEVYQVPREKIVLIPHGIHDTPFIDPSFFKDKFELEGRKVLLTFGLLGRNKGIEYMIEALADIVKHHPKTTYLVLGATHPAVVRYEGESYRLSLQRRVLELGLEKHVLFHPRFVDQDELLEYLGATDIFVAPYLNLDQITSGALSYAMGAGKAVVTTPFWHAEEVVSEERGILVPVQDAASLAHEINRLLSNEVLLGAMRKKAYLYCRNMIWPAVARSYLGLFNEVRTKAPKTFPVASSMTRPLSAANLPEPKLDHLLRLSDDTGLAHHAFHTIPDWSFGYYLEDAASGLVTASKYYNTFSDPQAMHLAKICLALIRLLTTTHGDKPYQHLDYARRPQGEASPIALGKVIWALGYVVHQGPDILVKAANDLFYWMVSNMEITHPRTLAYAILGSCDYLSRFGGATAVRRFLTNSAGQLDEICSRADWIDTWPGADPGVAVQAIAVYARIEKSKRLKEKSQTLANHLLEAYKQGTEFLKNGDNPDEEELPISATTFIEAMGAMFHLENNRDYLLPIRKAVDWYLGKNRINASLYDFTSGGCHDALTASGLNENQGTEATIFYLLAFLTLHRLANADRSMHP